MLHVIAPGAFGGAERVVLGLAGGQRARGVSVAVAAILDLDVEPGEHPLVRSLEACGVPVEPIPLPPRSYREERRALAGLIRRLGPDVVHTHGYRADVVDGSMAKMMGPAVITTVHGFTGGGWKNRFYEILQRRAYRRFDAVVAVSRALAGELRSGGVPAERIHVIRNAWRPDAVPLPRHVARERLGMAHDSYVVGWAGRLSPEKGPDLALDAVALLADLPLRLAVFGDGPLLQQLRSRAAKLDIAERVDWHGAIPDAGRLFTAFDLLLLSSRAEGTPMVLFEAMAARVPIVTAAVGGVPDVLAEGEALLVPAESPRALAAGIREAHANRDEAARRAARAAARLAQDFGWETWVEHYHGVYHAAVASRNENG